MRILTITPSLGLGGTERAAQNFSIGYRRHGQDVTVLNHGRVGPREAPLMDAGIRVVNLADQFAGALKSLDAERFDVVHIHREGRRNDRETDLLRWARPRARLIAETNVFFARDYGEASHWIDLHLQLAAINQLKWLRRGGEGLSAVVPNPVDVDDYPLPRPEAIQAFRTAHRISIGDFVFGRVGQPLMGKWDPCIVPAFAALAVRHPQIHLLLVGASPDVVERVQGLPQALRTRVTLLETLENSVHLGLAYGAMDGFLHAARQGESFGYVLTEALLYGLPVITVSRPHRDNAQTEVIRHGVDGYVVRSRAYLREAMERLLMDTDLCVSVRQRGRRGVIERFGIEKVTADSLGLFDDWLRGDIRPSLPVTTVCQAPRMAPGIGRASPVECALAKVYEWPWVDYAREQGRYWKRRYQSARPHS